MSGIGAVEFVFLLLLFFIVVFGILARKLGTPYPIIMVVGGLLLSFVPAVPDITLEPDLIFLVVLPPLLYASAWTTSWRDFRYNIVSISLLAFGLVAFTVIGVALAAPHVFPGFDWRLGLVLGAIVAPTDAIAATSIARRVGLPSRIVDILEGESLINDATGLLALEFAVGILVEKRMPTASGGLLTFVWLTAGGVAIGLVIGWIVDHFERWIDDGPIEVTISILVPYAAYLAAQSVHASGVLAVVSCGLFLSRQSARLFSPSVRIGLWSVWESLTFILNGLVFVLIGLQFPAIRASIRSYQLSTILTYGAVFSVLLILLRLAWVFPGAHLSYFLRTRIGHQKERATGSPANFCRWVDGHARRGFAGRCSCPSHSVEGRIAFPSTGFDYLLNVLRNFCDPGAAGPYPAASYPSAGLGRRGGTGLRGTGSAADRSPGCIGPAGKREGPGP